MVERGRIAVGDRPAWAHSEGGRGCAYVRAPMIPEDAVCHREVERVVPNALEPRDLDQTRGRSLFAWGQALGFGIYWNCFAMEGSGRRDHAATFRLTSSPSPNPKA